jgi:hypothetical protein
LGGVAEVDLTRTILPWASLSYLKGCGMARRDEEGTSYHDTFIMPPTFLPLFPDRKAILAGIPGIHSKSIETGMTNFLPWVDFTLENPDEIWEISKLEEKRFYHYINYLE